MEALRRLSYTVEMARPHNMLAAAGCLFSGYYVSGGRMYGEVLWPLIMTALVTGLGNLINDYFDAEIDRINKPRRPIPSGRLSPRHAIRSYWSGSAVVTVAMMLVLPRSILILMVIWEVLLYYYARIGKRLLLIGNLLIAVIASSAFVGGAMLTGDYRVVVPAGVLAFLLVMGRELIKDSEDVLGDLEVGARTAAVRFGVDKAVRAGAAFLLLCGVAVPVPALAGFYGRTYALIMQLLFVPGLLVAAHTVLRSAGREMANRASWVLKVDMFFGILAITFGRV